jgi:ABC-type antimicrobial peptide transport system permease subunit
LIYVPSHVYEIEQTLVVKTRAPLSTIGPAIKRAVEALGPGRPVFDIRLMDDVVEASIDNTRFTMLVLSGFAVASLLLAGIGLYGTLAYLTSQRMQEFGAIAVTRALSSLLYGVTPLDGLTIVSVAALVAVVALVAVAWPAWRAAHADPTTALRAE